MKKYLAVLLSFIGACAIVYLFPVTHAESLSSDLPQEEQEISILEQPITELSEQPATVFKVYTNGRLLGIMSDRSRLDSFLKDIYKEEYRDRFPDSSASLGKDVYIAEVMSYYRYTDIDDQILAYLKDNQLFSVGAVRIEFSDTDGIYAEIYALNEDIYKEAMQEYMGFFISASELATLNGGKTPDALKTYGSQAVGISIPQTITTNKAYASPDEVLMTKEDILHYLEYGNGTELEYYTVQKYDTVAGVGAKNYGLSATQIMNINRDKISSVDQVLNEGEQLCVTYFNSPIDIVVTKQSMRKETIYAETTYVENASLRAGYSEQTKEGVNGSKNSLYVEKWIDGVLISGTLESSVDTLQPVNAVIEIGTMQIPGVGTGTFRWPIDNVTITCRWGCYYGHRAIDLQNAYDHYGNIYAADRGIVEINSYNSVNGNYLVINHNNGYHTYYGHMNVPSPLAVGTVVDKGDIIGQIGMTGYATGPHTHFFIFDDSGNRYNPCDGFLDCDSVPG